MQRGRQVAVPMLGREQILTDLSEEQRARRPGCRNTNSGPDGPASVEQVALAGDYRTGDYVGARRPGGDAGGDHWRRAEAEPEHERYAGRRERDSVPDWCRARGDRVRLCDGSAGPQEAVHGDAADLPGGDRLQRSELEFLELCDLSLHYGHGDWWRIFCDQLGDR